MFLNLLLSLQAFFPNEEKMSVLENKIKKNETSLQDKVIYWHLHEPFPYLGLGRFIWFPKDSNFSYEEDFPRLLKFMKDSGHKLPEWLGKEFSCPWSSRQEFENDQKKQLELKQLLESGINLQIKFLVTHSFETFEKIVDSFDESCKSLMINKLEKLLEDPRGLYALIDYCQFKGSGLNEKEFKDGRGFGLKQVIEALPQDSLNVESFVKTAKDILKERAKNSHGHDEKWLSSWINRLDRYRNF
jgi:hypothetical protein